MTQRSIIPTLLVLATLLVRPPDARADDKPKPGDLPPGAEFVEPYVAPDKSFELIYPSGWKVTPGKAPGAILTIVEESKPPDQRHGIGLIATPAKPGQELKDVARGLKAAAPRKINAYKAVDDAYYDIGDWKVYRMVYDTKSKDGVPMRHINFTIVKEGVIYNLLVGGPPDQYAADEERANQICGSLKINAPPRFETPTPPAPKK
jgi:hypothetical protein